MLKWRTFAGVILVALLGHAAPAGAEAAAGVRPYPFPFTSVLTFASDVDEQAPWHGHAIHQLINEQIGLPISDSLWAQGSDANASSIFSAAQELNRRSSGVDGLPTYALLLREWHRGNVDHLHSWQDDNIVNLKNAIDPPVPLKTRRISIDLPGNDVSPAFVFSNLRLTFDRPIPKDLSLVLRGKTGNPVTVAAALVRKGQEVQAQPGSGRYMTEVLFNVAPDIGIPADQSFSLRELSHIELDAPSCEKTCDLRLLEIERDGFSRRNALLQLPNLLAWNIRPPLYTSHGGWTLAQDYAPAGTSFDIGRTPGSNYADPAVTNTLEPLADVKTRHVYLSDLLKKLGVFAVWSYAGMPLDAELNYAWNASAPPLTSHYAGFYDVNRTMITPFNLHDQNTFQRTLGDLGLRMSELDLSGVYCERECQSDQGAMVGPLIAASFGRMRGGQPAELFWYTHFATGDLFFPRSATQPLKHSAVVWLRHLAEAYYGFPTVLSPPQRVWVPPAATFIRYRIMLAHAADHISVDPLSSGIAVASWIDPVTGLRIPDPNAGTRDLDGLTIYVPDSAAASLRIDGAASNAFMRNPPDVTGRASITIVDDNTPTPILERVPAAAVASVSVPYGGFVDTEPPAGGSVSQQLPPAFRLIADAEGAAQANIGFDDLVLWNTAYLQLAYRKTAAGPDKPGGRMAIELEMADGGRIAVNESGSATQAAIGTSQWVLPVASPGSWIYSTLGTPQLRWGDPNIGAEWKRPALPIGRIKRVILSLTGASPGASLEIAYLRALRESGNGESPDGGKLIGGRVTRLGEPVPKTAIELAGDGGARQHTTTDSDGNYFFYAVARSTVISVAALTETGRCRPKAGAQMLVMRNNPEIDIDLDGCGRGSDW